MMGRGKGFSEQSQDMILSVKKFFEKESDDNRTFGQLGVTNIC